MARIQVSEHKIALGFSAGALASFTPFIGFHLVLAAAIAFILRGNLIASAVGTVVGNPLTFPLIWFSTYHVGAGLIWVSGIGPPEAGPGSEPPQVILGGLSSPDIWSAIQPVILPMLAGAVPLGFAFAVICYVLVFVSLRRIRSRYRRASAFSASADHLPIA